MQKFIKIFVFIQCIFIVDLLPVNRSALESSLTIANMYPDNCSGIPYLENYSSEDNGHHPQNWAVIEDTSGIIIIGNQGGVLEYDGVSWRRISIPNWNVRSLDLGKDGTIYVGGNSQFGCLKMDSLGFLQYLSFVKDLGGKHLDFTYVFQTHATAEGVYFGATKYLFRWKDGNVFVWEPEDSFHTSFLAGNKLYIRQKGVGLMHVMGDSLQLVPQGELFKEEAIYALCPIGKDKVLIGTRAKGFFIFDGHQFYPFPTSVDEYMVGSRLSHGIRLSDGNYAFATLRGGVVVLSPQGRLVEIFNKSSGLQDDNVKYVYQDIQGNLWLALNNGVSKIEYSSPLSVFDERLGLNGIVLSIVRHYQTLYAGTTRGLYFLETKQGKKQREIPCKSYFTDFSGIGSMCWSLLSTNKFLCVATNDGIYTIQKGNTNKVYGESCYVLYRSKIDTTIVYAGMGNGLLSFSLENNTMVLTRDFGYINDEIHTITEDDSGNLWLGTLTRGVIHVGFGYRNLTKVNGKPVNIAPLVLKYDTANGLPQGEVNVFYANRHVIFATEKGCYKFDEKDKSFSPDVFLGKEFANGAQSIFRLTEDSKGNIWIHSENKNYVARIQPDSTWLVDEIPFLRIPYAQVNQIYPEEAIVWFGGKDGLTSYSGERGKEYGIDFRTLVRRVLIDGDSLIYGGGKMYTKEPHLILLNYHNRNIRIEYAAAYYEGESAVKYRYILKGYDKKWSDWTAETKKDYTNLREGSYTFYVRAKNIYGHIGKEAVFPFKILPPWYRTWSSYVLYTVLFFSLLYAMARRRLLKLEKEKKMLEKVVAERTKEVSYQNRKLEKQATQLMEQSEKLMEMDRIKSRFFANISHEFRTPLTLINGPLEQMFHKTKDKKLKEKISMMLRNSRRLLNLINQLLDLSKLDSKKMNLQVSLVKIAPFIKEIIASFYTIASQKKIDLKLLAESENIELYIDVDKFEKVINNLLSNALKFTTEGGSVTVTLAHRQNGDLPGDWLEISVKDNGIGISGQHIPHIFDRFYQVENNLNRKFEGTGIGLSLTKELVELHHGKICVHSREGEGSEFIVSLPTGRVHLQAEEIADIPSMHVEPVKNRNTEEQKDFLHERIYDGRGSATEATVVLVVEDNKDIRDYIKEYLVPDYEVVEAVDGQDGLDKARRIIPDLIISDVMMPYKDGFELCNILKNDIKTSHIPVILLTAKAGDENIIRGLQTGADDYLTKPFNPLILLSRIKNLIELRHQLQLKFRREMQFQPSEIAVSSIDESFIQRIKEYIEHNISEQDLSIDSLCDEFHMSRATLYRKVRALTGESPNQFIRSYRLKRAAQLLKKNIGNISEIAYEVGFTSTAYFTKCFKEQFNQLPSSYLEGGDV